MCYGYNCKKYALTKASYTSVETNVVKVGFGCLNIAMVLLAPISQCKHLLLTILGVRVKIQFAVHAVNCTYRTTKNYDRSQRKKKLYNVTSFFHSMFTRDANNTATLVGTFHSSIYCNTICAGKYMTYTEKLKNNQLSLMHGTIAEINKNKPKIKTNYHWSAGYSSSYCLSRNSSFSVSSVRFNIYNSLILTIIKAINATVNLQQ